MSHQAPNIFLTGATGFVGGTILTTLVNIHPEAYIKALIRREEDANHLHSIHPNLEPVIGSLSDLDLLRSVAASVDFVIHATKEDIPAVLALIDGLASVHSAAPASARLISISGTRSLIDLSLPVTGTAPRDTRPWSDVEDIETILSLPKERLHADADQSIIKHATNKGVSAMIVAPGQLWGRGRGHIKVEGAAAAAYFAAVKKRGRAFIIGDGSVAWSWSSIGDLGDAVVFLMDQALSFSSPGSVGTNEQGYYFVQTDDVKMVDRAEEIGQRLELGKVESISAETAAEYHPFGQIMWGCGATFRPDRLTTLGWKSKEFDWRQLMKQGDWNRA